ncbi:MAG TPA: M20/M25/M40 family metallo-hydrolase [Pyrinomonadaceae bacterium]|nr:M20/M25/M40 family metallo-hydrolase [Pyrinomonadaceae bacterium]
MLYRKLFPRLLLAALLVAPPAVARQAASERAGADVERLRAHVAHLASEKLEGRRTGTRGAEEAARYVAAAFERLGLAPAGDAKGAGSSRRTFLQSFPYVAAVELGPGNSFVLSARGSEQDLRVGDDWVPLGFSANGKVEGAPVVFVGYGITASELRYDDYKGADVRGKVAVALSGTPDGDNPHGSFARAGDSRFKAAAARAAGAAALAIVAREENFKDDGLARLAYDNAGDAGLPVVAVSRRAAAGLLGLSGPAQLAEVEKSQPVGLPPSPGASGHAGGPLADNGLFHTWKEYEGTRGVALRLSTDVARRKAPAANVVGLLEGSDPKLRDEVIVLGAHYDHLGRGGRGSLATREGEVHHGADDNASGTAALVELARLLSREKKRMRRTLVFVAFGGEEEGLLGSKFYAEHPARPLAQTVAMLNMDMVGRLRDDALTVGGVGSAAEWRALLERANGRAFDVAVFPGGGRAPRPGERADVPIIVTGTDGRAAVEATPRRPFRLRLNEDGFGPSDHSSFYARRVPVLFFFTGTHEDYHKPSDTAERINYDGLARVAELVRDLVREIQSADARPTFTQARAESSGRATGFRVYLGTVPSYGDSSDGMKLDGVREGSPAAAAGLRAGDVIVRLAGREVRNVYDYTQALSEMKAGQEYEVEALRDGQRLSLKITPAARK